MTTMKQDDRCQAMKDWCRPNSVTVITPEEIGSLRRRGICTPLGSGAYGSCTRIAVSPDEFVVKKFVSGSRSYVIQKELYHLRRNQGWGVQKLYGFCPATGELLSAYSGVTLDQCIRRDLLSPRKALHVLTCVMKVIEDMLRRNQCHNDIKPNNICVQGILTDNPTVTLIDFGVANYIGKAPYAPIPEENDHLHPWIAPELRRGGNNSEQSEVFSIGRLARQLFPQIAPQGVFHEWVAQCENADPRNRPSLSHSISRLQTHSTNLMRRQLEKKWKHSKAVRR